MQSRLLHVAVQSGQACLWAEVTPGERQESRKVFIYGTGHDLEEGRGDYLGSFMLDDGTLVFHAYAPSHT